MAHPLRTVTRMAALAFVIVGVRPAIANAPARTADVGQIVREPIAFSVTNPAIPGSRYTIHGELVRPRAGCTGSVLLAMHGLSYGAWAWDFPLDPPAYSVAQSLAERGYATVAVDELGYGTSAGEGAPDHPNGYTLTVESYADMAAQIAKQLRAGAYTSAHAVPFSHVGLMGHSAGSEIIEMAAALNPGLADVVIPTSYTHDHARSTTCPAP